MDKRTFFKTLRALGISKKKPLHFFVQNREEAKDLLLRLFAAVRGGDSGVRDVASICINVFFLMQFLSPANQKKRRGFEVSLFGHTTETVVLVPGINLPDSLTGLADELIEVFAIPDSGFKMEVKKEKAPVVLKNNTQVWHMQLSVTGAAA